MKLKVAACQILTSSDLEASTEKICTWIDQASEAGVDIVSFPEAAICGYTDEPGYWEKFDEQRFAAAEQKVIERSKSGNIAVVLGTVWREDGHLQNGLLAIDKGGEVRGRYAKTHLAEGWPAPGKKLPVYQLAGVWSCFIICHDVRYPELVRLPAAAGAQICFFSSNESGLLQEHKLSAYHAMPVSRATENAIFVVMSNAPGDVNNLYSKSQSHGNSKIIHPDGNVLDEASFFEERLVTQEIDVDHATRQLVQRAMNDDCILKDWMRGGVDLVDREEG